MITEDLEMWPSILCSIDPFCGSFSGDSEIVAKEGKKSHFGGYSEFGMVSLDRSRR